MRTILPALALALALALPASASHCTTWTTSTTNEDTIVLDLGPAAIDFRYVVNDLCNVPRYNPNGDGLRVNDWHNNPFIHVPGPFDSPSCVFSIWLYYESNGIEGLQRGDEVVDDSCHWTIESDYFVW